LKNSVIGIIALGATGSIVGSIIQGFATSENNYTGIEKFFSSNVTIPSWSLLTIIMLILLMVYVCILVKRDAENSVTHKKEELDLEIQKIKDAAKTPDLFIKEQELKAKRFKLAKLLISYLQEDYPRSSETLCNLACENGTYTKEYVLEIISDLVHHNIFENYIRGGFKLVFMHERSLIKNFKP
jgi:uncharacterized membrane protein